MTLSKHIPYSFTKFSSVFVLNTRERLVLHCWFYGFFMNSKCFCTDNGIRLILRAVFLSSGNQILVEGTVCSGFGGIQCAWLTQNLRRQILKRTLLQRVGYLDFSMNISLGATVNY